jgi:hypothetical protein
MLLQQSRETRMYLMPVSMIIIFRRLVIYQKERLILKRVNILTLVFMSLLLVLLVILLVLLLL